MTTNENGWIGVDLDGTLAEYSGWKGPTVIGAPITKMIERVKAWLAEGKDVRIFTARISNDHDVAGTPEIGKAIADWCAEHIGRPMEITCRKDYHMLELWDDRAVQVVPNTGVALQEAMQSATVDAVKIGWREGMMDAARMIFSSVEAFKPRTKAGPRERMLARRKAGSPESGLVYAQEIQRQAEGLPGSAPL